MVGKDKTKQGKVLKCNRKKNTVLVEGCNLVKRHIRGTSFQAGGIATKEAPIHVSNVAVVDPSDNLPTRTRKEGKDKDGFAKRVSKRTGNEIPRPEGLKVRSRPREEMDQDTTPDHATEYTYDPT